MEHIDGPAAGHRQQISTKKKSKNKKKNFKTEGVANDTTSKNFDDGLVGEAAKVNGNGLNDQLKQQLNIDTQVNGLVTTFEATQTNQTLSTIAASSSKTKEPAEDGCQNINGHHHHGSEYNSPEKTIETVAIVKKTKRKRNNKKTSAVSNKSETENGYCLNNVSSMEINADATKRQLPNGLTHETIENKSPQKENEYVSKECLSNTTASCEITLTNEEEKSHSAPTHSQSIAASKELNLANVHISYKEYESELQMHDIMRLIQAELSEPYSIYTYRYFIYNWPKLCFLAAHGNEYVGAIVCKLDMHMNVRRGYIAMLAVRKEYRKLKIGTTLVQKAIEAMLADNADEVVLETEMSNVPALRLYENLGFVRDKRLFRYYLNGVDALRLKLWFR
uniref:N-terminal methionine N(alpha)-acetyltransferase NatC n=1 Tax=Glossina austeni TaxID=7395 RepID=A0A1A9VCR8_GLOAU